MMSARRGHAAFLAAILGVRAAAYKIFQESWTTSSAFEAFLEKYGRTYMPGTPEFSMRSQHFEAKLAAIERHNSRPDRQWTASISEFADRTPAELAALDGWRGGAHVAEARPVQAASLLQDPREDPLPEEYSWEGLWATLPEQIRSQECGNCWAAATAAMLETHQEIHMGEKRKFSIGELTYCTINPFACGGEGHCQGATPELALEHVRLNGVGEDDKSKACPEHMSQIVDDREKPPHEWPSGKASQGESSRSLQFGMYGWKRLPENEYKPLLRALVELGPVAVAISTSWGADRHAVGLHDYKGGIYDGCAKDAVIGHSVLLIGYGKDGGNKDLKYWLLQNSWGAGWGEKGHFRFTRHDDEESYCGSDTSPQLGTECRGGRKSVRICGTCGILYDNVVPLFRGRSGNPAQPAGQLATPRNVSLRSASKD